MSKMNEVVMKEMNEALKKNEGKRVRKNTVSKKQERKQDDTEKKYQELLNELNNTNKKKFITITVSEKQMIGRFNAKETGVEYTKILAPEGYSFVRKSEKIKPSVKEGKVCFTVPEDYNFLLQKNTKISDDEYDEQGNILKEAEYKTEEKYVTARELSDMYEKAAEEYKLQRLENDFVTITVNKECVGKKFEFEGNEYHKITAPGGWSCIRPAEYLKLSEDGEKVSFSLPKDYSLNVKKSYVVKPAIKDDSGDVIAEPEYGEKKRTLSAEEFSMLFEEIEILFHEKNIIGSVPMNDTVYYRVLVQEGYTILLEHSRLEKGDDGISSFKAFAGENFRLQHVIKRDNVPDNAPPEEKYINEYANINAAKLSEIMWPGERQDRGR